MTINFSRFAAGIAAAVLAGAGILGALLPGCFNPLAAGSPGVAKTPGGPADVWTEPEPFEVAIQIRQANPDTSLGGRSIAGPGNMQMTMRGTDSIRNFAQLIVMDPESRSIVFASQQRRENDADTGTEFPVNNLTIGRTYVFFLLMGHWERNYSAGTTTYEYKNLPPTLLAAGLAEPELKEGSQTITIAMFPIQVDTKFTPLENTAAQGQNPVEPLMVNYQPFPAFLYTAPGAWRFDWTVKGQGAYRALNYAQYLARAREDDRLGFLYQTTMVKRGTASYAPTASFPTPFPTPDSGATSVTNFGSDIGSDNGLLFINWTKDDGLPVTVTIDKVKVEANSSTVTTDYGWGYFNLAYVPFGKLDPKDWERFRDDYPAFYTSELEAGNATIPAGLPRWIIRNGINDKQQNEGTRFSPSKPWNDDPSAAVNGNGGVRFVGTRVDVNTVSSTVFTYYVGTPKVNGGNGDGSQDNPYNSVRLALNQLASDYTAWKATKATVASILGDDAVTDLEAWGDIRVIGNVTTSNRAIVDGTHPTVYLRDYYVNTSPSPPIKLSFTSTGNLIQVASGGKLILTGSLNLVGSPSNNTSLVQVAGELILEDQVVIKDNVAGTGGGGGVYVNDGGTFTMEGGEILNNVSYTTRGGGGVYVDGGGKFIMEGGKIRINNATASGGGVAVNTAGEFTMRGGEIGGNVINSYGNGASRGGGVHVYGSFTMEGGKIWDNKAQAETDAMGGGVYVNAGGTFIMAGGEIYGNSTKTEGRNSDPEADTNPESNGGGVCLVGTSIFTMTGGKIYNNEATSHPEDSNIDGDISVSGRGGGVYLQATNGTGLFSFIKENTGSIITGTGGLDSYGANKADEGAAVFFEVRKVSSGTPGEELSIHVHTRSGTADRGHEVKVDKANKIDWDGFNDFVGFDPTS
jgi:hypothetical protein